MPPRRKSIPSYLPHTQSGKARAVWTDQTGTRQFRMLPGAFDSPESRAAFAALLLELQAAPHQVQAPEPTGLTMAELLLKYLDHAERHYLGHDGKHTSEIYEVRVVIRAVRELYADKVHADGVVRACVLAIPDAEYHGTGLGDFELTRVAGGVTARPENVELRESLAGPRGQQDIREHASGDDDARREGDRQALVDRTILHPLRKAEVQAKGKPSLSR